jgi:tRNA (guanosine-2'-O-)-methyltransferase
MSTEARNERFRQILALRQNSISVLLENVEDPHNINAVLRTADSIGCKEIFVLNNRMPIHEKWSGFRSSSGANKWVMLHQYKDTASCVQEILSRYDVILGTHLAVESKSLYDVDFSKKVVLAFGSEANGLTDELLQHCAHNYIIPQLGLSKSLNISVACAVSLYEGHRQKANLGHYTQPQLSEQEQQELITFWKGNDSRLGL